FHHHVDDAVGSGSKIVNCNGVRMSKTPCGLSLTPEATKPLGIVADLWRKNFYGDAVAEQYVTRAINRSHTTFAQHRIDLILPVENRPYQRRWVIFQDFSINWAKTYAVVVFSFTDLAMFHRGLSPNDAETQAS